MKKLLNVALFLMITVLNCQGQNDWKPGYIIKNSGDTIFGSIDNRDSKSNTKQCFFRKDSLSESTVYEPQDIAGYRIIDGKYFVSKNIPDGGSTRKLFLEFLIHGKVDVFHYEDRESHFFLGKGGKLYELKNTTSIVDIDSNYTQINKSDVVRYELDKKEYIGLLNYLMQDANLRPLINNTRLNSESLISLAKKYHDRVCTTEQCIIFEKQIDPTRITISVQAGESINSLNWGGELASDFGFSTFVGCRFDFQNLFIYSENLSFVLDVNLQQYSDYNIRDIRESAALSYNGKNYRIYNEKYQEHYYTKNLHVDLNTVVLKIPVVFNYIFSKGKIKPYVGFGLSNTIVLSQNKDLKITAFYDEYKKSIPTYLIGFLGRAGCKYDLKNNHAVYADLSFDFSENMNLNQILRLSNTICSLTAGYTF